MSTFNFSQQALQKSASNYQQVTIPASMRHILVGVSNTIAKYINIPPLALRGFLLFSAREAQQKLHLFAADMPKMSPENRKKFIMHVFTVCEQKLKKILVNPSREDVERLHKGMLEALEFRLSQPF